MTTARIALGKMTDMSRPNNGPIYALSALALGLVGIVALVLIFGQTDGDVERVITFAGIMVTNLIGFVTVFYRLNAVDGKTEDIAKNVNGKLDARLNRQDEMLSSIHDKIEPTADQVP